VTVSNNQWLSPAHAGKWMMDVDDRQQPSQLILRRDRAAVLTLSITSAAEVPTVVDRLIASSGIPRGVANQLAAQLAAKLAVIDGRLSSTASG
jgi:hypothetical protein